MSLRVQVFELARKNGRINFLGEKTGPSMTTYSISRAIKKTLKKAPVIRKVIEIRNRYINEKLINSYHEDGPRVACDACKTLESAGISAWLYAGSLLGVVREGDFLPWDNDLDLCLVADKTFDWGLVENLLVVAGYEKIREFRCDGRITEQAYAFGESHFDIFAMEPLDDDQVRVCMYVKKDDVWYSDRNHWTVMCLDTYLPKGKKMVDVRGYLLPVPENSEQILDKQYGPNWRTPDPAFASDSTYRVLSGAKGRSTLFLR